MKMLLKYLDLLHTPASKVMVSNMAELFLSQNVESDKMIGQVKKSQEIFPCYLRAEP